MPAATIVGAGVFGGWIAYALHRRGWRITLVEQHGPGNSRASSGGETRIIRCGYGDHAIYAAWARDALPRWIALEQETGIPLFTRTGVLFVGRNEAWLRTTLDVLRRERVPAEWIESRELSARYPSLHFPDAAGGVFEPDAGVLFARRAVQALVHLLGSRGVTCIRGKADARSLIRNNTDDALVFAAGAWLPALFPDVLGDFIAPTRQEVFFFGSPADLPAEAGSYAFRGHLPAEAGSHASLDHRVASGFSRKHSFDPESLPAWVAFDEGIYGLPDLEHRGVKIAIDAHGTRADPETMDRVVDARAIERMREVLRRHLPSLADAPLLESRVCQYENTPDGHFLLDRLPGHDRVWIAGGGSGHGFKHGPTIGEHLADLIEGRRQPEPMFALAGRPVRARAVY